jgi:hypothetical protein
VIHHAIINKKHTLKYVDKEIKQREEFRIATHNVLCVELMETAFQIQNPSVLPESVIMLTKTNWRMRDTVDPKDTVSSQVPIPVPTPARVIPSRDSQISIRILRVFKIAIPSNAEERRPRVLVWPRKLSPSRVKLKSASPATLEPA